MIDNSNIPLFSVVIPIYNVSGYITDTIQSVLNQTCQDFEIIAVDDGSTDKSAEDVKAFNDSRIHYIYQDNAGVSAARNTGIANATGKYVALLDGDDYWHPQHLELAKKAFEQYPEITWYASKYERTQNHFNAKTFAKKIIYSAEKKNYFISGYQYAWSSCVIFSRDTLQNLNFRCDLKIGEDNLFWAMYAAQYPNILIDNAKTSFYLQRETSVMHCIFKNNQNESLICYHEILKMKFPIDDYKNMFVQYCFSFLAINVLKYNSIFQYYKLLYYYKRRIKNLIWLYFFIIGAGAFISKKVALKLLGDFFRNINN